MSVISQLSGLVSIAFVLAEVSAPTVTDGDERDATALRASVEDSMATLGQLANVARRQVDLVQATCVLDAQERAAATMELATSELLVLNEASVGPQARELAQEKLRAAADRLDALVQEASRCATDGGPEAVTDVRSVEVVAPRSIPLADPTQGLGASPLPPVVDGGWVPVASPME
ncbi:MAG: hypothetical protein B7733_25135 [Myxococcales bacterium FL481]|nr:MAG: hypothetical protein B7733_25135 [Myxococcales bacterium FL481]